jgi:hypothetical protein
MKRGEVRRNDGVFDGNPRAITLLPKKLAFMAKDDMQAQCYGFFWLYYTGSSTSDARLRYYFIQLGS